MLEWNEGLAAGDNKSALAFRTLAGFLRRLWRQHANEAVHVVIDRQGGRTQYSRPLFEGVRPQGIRIEQQSEETSSYLLLRRRRADAGDVAAGSAGEFRVTFTKESEEKVLGVALASMLSKYLRELHMALFNEYWLEHRTDLKPTAGYVQDARRFLADTTDLRRELGLNSALLIREK